MEYVSRWLKVIIITAALSPAAISAEWESEEIIVRATAYCPCGLCCNNYSDGLTAIGRSALLPGLAVDPETIPLNSRVDIPGYDRGPNNNGSWILADDVGGAIKGNAIDIRFKTHKEAQKWGTKQIKIRIWKKMFEFRCKKCGKLFHKNTPKNRGKLWQFCGYKCRHSYKTSKVCKVCNKKFDGNNLQTYCSKSCQDREYRSKKRHKFTCQHCGNEYSRHRKDLGSKFCSVQCANQSSHKGLIKKITEKHGYISTWCPNHPKAHCGRMREHRLIMEDIIGRHLTNKEIVHHKNHIKSDNRPENLQLCKNDQEHNKIHGHTNYLIIEFIKEKGLGEELTKFINERSNNGK